VSIALDHVRSPQSVTKRSKSCLVIVLIMNYDISRFVTMHYDLLRSVALYYVYWRRPGTITSQSHTI